MTLSNDLNKDFYERLIDIRLNHPCHLLRLWRVESLQPGLPGDRDDLQWGREVGGQVELLSRHALVDPSDITGSRAPFVQTGGDVMLRALSPALQHCGLTLASSPCPVSPSPS